MVAKFVVGGYYKLINMDGKTNVEIIHENWLKEFDAWNTWTFEVLDVQDASTQNN